MMYRTKDKLIIVVVCIFFFGIYPIKIFAQNTWANEIPEWIKGKTTPEEYELWERMNANFIIDYSFLKKDLSSAKKEKLYKSIELLINVIEERDPSGYSSKVFIVDVLPKYSSSDLQAYTTKFTVYSSKYRSDTRLDVFVSYAYNGQTGKISNVISQPQAVGTIHPYPYGNNVGVNDYFDMIQGACSGVLRILKNGEGYNEVFSNAIYYILPL